MWRSHRYWLVTWSVTLQCKGLVWYADGSRMCGRSVADVCSVVPGKRLSLSLGVLASVPGRDWNVWE